jgi:hypothetical protein
VLNLKAAAFLVPIFGLFIAMVEEWWWYKELLAAIDLGSGENKGVQQREIQWVN